ncbi:PAS domain S-box protein [Chloroflexus sp.]|uniref:PAS domain S-box protein n=1 Tax=Chloroflexus sp. TaxID=1904827 RepID=UPI0026123BF2|nr:PAS domain S-box protein [uncultured Chloroflexus sp.]
MNNNRLFFNSIPLSAETLWLALVWLVVIVLWFWLALIVSIWLQFWLNLLFVILNLAFSAILVRQSLQQVQFHRQTNYLIHQLNQLAGSDVASPQFEQEVCRFIGQSLGLRLVWIGLIDLETTDVQPVAWWGPASDYLSQIRIRLNDPQLGRGPTGTTLRSGKPRVANDIATDPVMLPWRSAAMAHGLRASAALPLQIDGRLIGTLNLYAGQKHVFTAALIDDGMMLAGMIARAIESRRRAMERDQTRALLAQSEGRFRRLAEQAPDIIFRYVLAPQSRLDFVNPAVREILGYDPDTLLRHTPIEAIIGAEQYASFERLLAQGRGRQLLQARHCDGHSVWLDVHFTVVDGVIEGIARDVTAQVESAAHLARYELLSQHARDIVLFVRASDGKILEANRAAEIAYGYSRAELCARAIHDLRAPETRANVYEQMAQANTQGILFETWHLRRDGSKFPVEVSSTGADIEGERVLLSVIRDISERRQAQAEIEQLRVALNATAQAIVITDLNGVIEWVNPAFTTLTGYTAAEAVGQSTRILRSGRQDKAFYAALWNQILSGQTWRGELVNRRKDGSLYVEEMTITPVRLNSGEISRFIAIKHDVTERVQREQQQNFLNQLSEAMRAARNRAELTQVIIRQLTAVVPAQLLTLWRETANGWQVEQACGEIRWLDGLSSRVSALLPTIASLSLWREPMNDDGQRELIVVPARCVDCDRRHTSGAIVLICAEALPQSTFNLLMAIADRISNALHRTELFEQIQRTNAELRAAYDATIEGWARALDLRDHETEGHSRRVTRLTVRIAERMGLSGEELVHIRRGALLHDIGKIGVPDAILNKPGPLNDEEWAIMRLHPTLAYELLQPITFLAPAIDIPWCHHEKWDGTGYPRGLRGEEIPLAARIFAVVDVYDALTSDRPYRPAWTSEQALAYIRDQAGRHFDPRVVAVFVEVLAEEMVGAAPSAQEGVNNA